MGAMPHNTLEYEMERATLSIPLLNYSDSNADQEGLVENPEIQDKAEVLSIFCTDKLTGRTYVGFMIVLFVLIGSISVPSNEMSCMTIDFVHNLLTPISDWLLNPTNHFLRDFLLIVFCLSIDTIFLGTFINWINSDSSIRFLAAIMMFMFGKVVNQYLWNIPVPQDAYWVSPGIPSIVVSFGSIGEFFFSGYTGFLYICMKELDILGLRKTSRLVGGFTVYAMCLLLVLRANYSIDLLASLLFADWCFEKSCQYREKLDDLWVRACSHIKLKERRISLSKMSF